MKKYSFLVFIVLLISCEGKDKFLSGVESSTGMNLGNLKGDPSEDECQNALTGLEKTIDNANEAANRSTRITEDSIDKIQNSDSLEGSLLGIAEGFGTNVKTIINFGKKANKDSQTAGNCIYKATEESLKSWWEKL